MNPSGILISRNGIFWLAGMLVLTQMPHSLHLPLWVSLSGITLVLAKTLFAERFSRYFPSFILVVLAIAAGVAIKLQYGYFLGRDPCVAFLFLLLALKFSETRQRRDVTLLICLSGFLLFTQYFYSQTLTAALVSLPAVFAMGGSLYILRDHSHDTGVRPVLRMIGRLLLQGLPLAAVLFVLFPRLSSPLWSLPDDASASTGLSDHMAPGSISHLSLSDKVAFRVEFEGTPPAKKELYWRGPVLSLFDGREWSASAPGYRANASSSNKKPTNYIVTLEAHRNHWLFALDMAADLPYNTAHSEATARPIAHLDNKYQLLSEKAINTTIRYRQSSYISDAYFDPQPRLSENAQLAKGNQKTYQFAQRLRRQYASDKQLIAAVLRWLNTENFYYTLTPSLLGDNPVDEFLFDTREGFCEHYASAFVYLLRSAGIPARVVTGYQGGEMNGDYLIVRQSDAHAWAEVWLNGLWQRYDPTAAVAPSRVISGMASALSAGEPIPLLARLDRGWLKQIQLGWDAVNHKWRKHIINFGQDTQLTIFDNFGMPSPRPWQIMLLIFTVALLWSLMILKVRISTSADMSEGERLWSKFINHLQNAGMPPQQAQGPLDYCTRACQRWPEQASLFNRITHMFIQLHYGKDSQNAMRRKLLQKQMQVCINKLPSSTTLSD